MVTAPLFDHTTPPLSTRLRRMATLTGVMINLELTQRTRLPSRSSVRYQEIMVYYTSVPSLLMDVLSIEDNIDAHFRITNDLDATQATPANQPKIYDSVTGVVTENGNPAVEFDGSSSNMSTASLTSTAQPTTHFISLRRSDADAGNQYAVDSRTTNQIIGTLSTNSTMYAGTFLSDGALTSNQEIQSALFNGSSSSLHRDGLEVVTGDAGSGGWTGATLGSFSNLTQSFWEGKIQEYLVYTSDQSSNRSNIEDSINEFYSVYDKSSYRLLDYYRDAAAAFSLRKLLSTYTGSAIEVRRDSDDTTQDIGFTANGDLDTAALAAFCGSSDGFVQTWYDQSGNSFDFSNSTQQPKIYDGDDGVNMLNGKPAIFFTGDVLENTDSIVSTPSEYWVSWVVRRDTDAEGPSINRGLFDTFGNRMVFDTQKSGWLYDGLYSGNPIDYNNEQKLGFLDLQTGGGNAKAYVNGQLHDTDTYSARSITGDNKIGFGGTQYMIGDVQEFIIWTSDQSDNRSVIQDDINNYYSVYEKTKLLDFHPDAAAAYSLRKLMGQYSGSAIKVRRDSDDTTQDIGFDANGDLDTAALAAFCGSDNGFVETWYDQAGSNDATQTTTTKQPKIYDGDDGVVTENAEAAMDVTEGQGWSLSSAVGASSQKFAFIVHAVDASDTSWCFFGDTIAGAATPLAEDGSTSTTLTSTAFNPLNSIHKNGSALTLTTRDALHSEYTAAGQSLTVMDFEGTAGVGVFLNRGGGRDYSGTIQALIIYTSDQSSNRSDIEDDIKNYYSIY